MLYEGPETTSAPRMLVSIPVTDLSELPLVCAWNGCREVCSRNPPLPEGWIWLATYYDVAVPGVLDFTGDKVVRDAVLCPQHAAELESKLKPL